MKASGTFRRLITAGVASGLLTAGVGFSAIAAGAASNPDANWTIKVASSTTATPNWAFPYQTGGTFSVSNINDFQNLMYRPLYWFGTGSTIDLNTDLSLATAPVYSNGNRTVTVTLKSGYNWSNGAPVQAKDVIFWMNLMAAFPGVWAGYVPPLPDGTPLGIPDLITSITAPATNKVVFNLSRAVSPYWFTYNELSQITPLPQAWDLEPAATDINNFPAGRPGLTGAGSAVAGNGNLDTKTAGCWSNTWVGNGNTGPSDGTVAGETAYGTDLTGTNTVVTDANVDQAIHCVYVRYTMRSFSNDKANYTTAGTDTARLWGITNGPWKMKSYDYSAGAITFSPSSTYGGQKAYAKELQYIPCTGTDNCYNLTLTGTVDSGGLPSKYATPITKLSDAGKYQPAALKSKGYTLTPTYSWVTNYFPMNFNSTAGAAGEAKFVFAQKYFRQALGMLTDQDTMVKTYMNGYGYATYGPIPAYPKNSLTKITKPVYKFSVSAARALLAAHGWSNASPATCLRPGSAANQCGAGISAGTPLQFSLEYASGSDTLDNMMTFLKSTWAQAGIKLTLNSVTFNTVIGDAFGGNTSWDFANWGGGWLYAPDYYPTGESLFATGSGSNAGAYSSSAADNVIKGTVFGGSTMSAYENLIAQEAPVIWMPSGVGLAESKKFKNHIYNPLSTFTPEFWKH